MSGGAYHRWLQIEGNSGSGKSSLVNAGMLPMVECGALWAHTGYEQGKLADMYSTMNASRAYVYAVGRACDAASTILYSAEKATWMAGEAIQALGGNGYVNEYATGRLCRDAKLYEIGAGTSEIRRWLIGRELFEDTK